jgi:hypothetical protein
MVLPYTGVITADLSMPPVWRYPVARSARPAAAPIIISVRPNARAPSFKLKRSGDGAGGWLCLWVALLTDGAGSAPPRAREDSARVSPTPTEARIEHLSFTSH